MNNDLISRSALIDSLYEHEFQIFCPLDDVSTVIDAEPAVDAVPVVRCKNCLCMGKLPPHARGYREDAGWCMSHGHVVLPTDFCSDAERIEEDDDE